VRRPSGPAESPARGLIYVHREPAVPSVSYRF